ncbi:hypothetical protein [Streptomyces californicus]|uniref:hypothetical protein n=1 Tax=Streptomyces californicus TaxID=67351 RepID=UPI0004BFA0FF|nr:hypothetical protein [Streptomyces californicus]QRV59344.1 hypothetical protein I6J40_34350 [Streptomyces californicus]
MSDDHARAQDFLDELYRLNGADTLGNPGQTPATRIQVRTADGQLIGEALLSARSTEETTLAISAVAEYALTMPADYQAGRTPAPEVDPLLIADLEDYFAAVDPQSYLPDVFACDDPEVAAAAYEQMVTGEWDGEL